MNFTQLVRRFECFLEGHKPQMVVICKVAYLERCKYCHKKFSSGFLVEAEDKTPKPKPTV